MGKNTERVIVRANTEREIVLLFPDLKHEGRMTTWNAQTGQHGDGLPAEYRQTQGIQERSDSLLAVGTYERKYKTKLVRVAA